MIARRAAEARVAEVRHAARAWRKAGMIDPGTLTAIETAYPDSRLRLAGAWRVLIFIIVSVAANAIVGVVAMETRARDSFGLWLFFAVALAAATEALLRSERIGENGSAAATSFWAATYAIVGCAFVFLEGPHQNTDRAVTVAILAATVVFAAACWHWGFEAYAVSSAVAFFVLLARFPGGRLWWILAGLLIVLGAARALDRAALAPPLRRACAGILFVGGLAFYAACNRYVLDRRLIEFIADGRASRAAGNPSPTISILSDLAMAGIPVLFIAWGLHERRTLLIDLGALLAAASLVTLRYYVHLAPLWFLLSAAGAALVLAALGLNRRLRRAPGGEWAGFTARPLYSGRSARGLESAAVVAAFAPDALPAREDGGFTPGGGGFGGGGATGSF